MKPIKGGVTKVTHINGRANGPQNHETFAKGEPKGMDMGRDLSGDATNVIQKIDCCAEESPRAKALSTGQSS